MEKAMCCTTCPSGCALTVTVSGDKIQQVTGNKCKRGLIFAEKELVQPERMLTSTVIAIIDNREYCIPVKSQKPVPLTKMTDIMNEIRKIRLDKAVHMGDVIIPNTADSGIPIVSCKTVS